MGYHGKRKDTKTKFSVFPTTVVAHQFLGISDEETVWSCPLENEGTPAESSPLGENNNMNAHFLLVHLRSRLQVASMSFLADT